MPVVKFFQQTPFRATFVVCYEKQLNLSRWNVKVSNINLDVTHQQFNIQQLYVLPTLYLCVLYLSENKQRLVSLTA